MPTSAKTVQRYCSKQSKILSRKIKLLLNQSINQKLKSRQYPIIAYQNIFKKSEFILYNNEKIYINLNFKSSEIFSHLKEIFDLLSIDYDRLCLISYQ